MEPVQPSSERRTFRTAAEAKVRSGKDAHGNSLREPESNTLTDTQTMLTTISVLYEAAKKLLQAHDINPQLRPGADKLEEFYEEVSGSWATLLKDFKLYSRP